MRMPELLWILVELGVVTIEVGASWSQTLFGVTYFNVGQVKIYTGDRCWRRFQDFVLYLVCENIEQLILTHLCQALWVWLIDRCG